jgi:hypothetical protein
MHGFTLLSDKTLERSMHFQKRDWKKYNKELVNRGKINFWVKPEVFKNWKAKKRKKNGRPFEYGNEVIEAMSYIRFKFHQSLRETEGFFQSLVCLKRVELKVPCYTQLCRRMRKLKLPKELLDRKGVTDIVLDTTGLKVYGEGEWRAEKYGGKRSWKKLHLALDSKSGKLIFAEISNEHVHDTAYLEQVLQRANNRKGKVLIDGIADSKRCYALARRYKKDLVTPPKKGAIFRREPELEKRNEAVGMILGLGGDLIARSIWAKLVGYSGRAIAESMMSRWKRLHGSGLKSRCEIRKGVEVKIKALMINKMIENQAA